MTRTLVYARALAALLVAAAPLSAQVDSRPRYPLPDSARLAGVMRVGLAMQSPAKLLLTHREELKLTEQQVHKLEALAAVQAESLSARQGRSIRALMEERRQGMPPTYVQAMQWTGRLDEARLRAEACERAQESTESLIGLAHDRRAAGALLTPEQLRAVPAIERRQNFANMRRIVSGDPMPNAVQVTTDGEPPVYFEFQVSQPVTLVPGTATPAFPASLRGHVSRGEVLAQFVVDTTGQVEMPTFKVIKTDHPFFTDAVRQALPSMRFVPAELGGQKVKQLVQMPFEFRAP